MQLSIEKTFSYWMPIMIPYLGRDRTEDACDLMRPILEKAIAAEKAGRIAFMQAAIGPVNTADGMRRGNFFLEVVYHQVKDGIWQRETVRFKKQILKGIEDENETAPETTRQAVES